MAASSGTKLCAEAASLDYDAIVIGAGISGMTSMRHRRRIPEEKRARRCGGWNMRVVERADGHCGWLVVVGVICARL